MTERAPIVDGAPACPFVAFEDDRDERASAPDHRHRCYAEPEPAPRALAHQEAYCLASAFPVCPTFQDWARREAARSRNDPMRSGASDSAIGSIDLGSSQRNPPRDWSAPPPWAPKDRGSGARGGPDGGRLDFEDESDSASGDVPVQGRGLSGSYADRVASDAGPAAAGPAGQATDDDRDDDFAPALPPAAAVEPTWADDEPGGPQQAAPQAPRRRERDPGRVAAFSGQRHEPAPDGRAGPRQEARHERRPHEAPEWERAKPPETYPTLRARRLPDLSLSPILVAAVAVLLAAAVLFALPGLLGFGNPSAGSSPTPTTPVRTSIPSVDPTPIPQPTQQIYLVSPGDTMSRIAGKFGLTLEELIAANLETVPDPNKLQIGQEIIIPAQGPDGLPGASGEIPAAS